MLQREQIKALCVRFAAFFGFAWVPRWVRFWVIFGSRFNVFNDFWVRFAKNTFFRRALPAESHRLSSAGRSCATLVKQIFKFSKITRAAALSDIPSSGQLVL